MTHISSEDHQLAEGTGIIVEVHIWEDLQAWDNRGFGTTITVLWEDGSLRQYEEEELDLIKVSQ